MADRKENELTKANNFEYVRALDSNGNSIQISKSDLVSVLEGLMSSMGLFPYNKTVLLTTDFNSINKSGWQMITNAQEMLNRPSFMENNYWIIESIKCAEGYFLVRVTSLNNKQAIRTCNSGIWSSWKEI